MEAAEKEEEKEDDIGDGDGREDGGTEEAF